MDQSGQPGTPVPTDSTPLTTSSERPVQASPVDATGPLPVTPAQGISLEEEAPATIIERPAYTPYVDPALYRPTRRRLQYLILGSALIAGITLVLFAQHRPTPTTPVNSIDKQYGKVSVPLDKLPANTASSASSLSGIVTVNGQLNVQNSLVLGPMTQPASPLTGQLFYNQETNRLSYFDGKQYQSVLASPTPDALTQALSAPQQDLSAGRGLSLNGTTLTNNGVLSLQGSSGAVTLNGGNGIAVTGTTFTNTGVLSFGGQNGNISVGSGLSVTGGTLKNSGVVTVLAGSGLSASDDGNGNVTISVLPGAGTGNVNTPGGTTGSFAVFSDGQTISNSLLTQSGSSITADGDLAVTGSLSLGQALSVGNGGTGANNFTSGGIIVGNGSNAFTALTGVAGQCLIADVSGGASYQTCPGGSGNTTPTLQDVYTNSNSSPAITLNGVGKGISIRDNGTPIGGNLLSVTNNTGSNIYFAVTTGGVNVTGNLTATGFSGDGAGITNLNASHLASGTVGDARLSTNVALLNGSNNFTGTLQHNGNNVCDTSGNCVGAAGGGIGGNGTANKVALFTGSGYTIGNSMLSQDVSATTVTVAGALSTTGNISTTGSLTAGTVTAGTLSGNGASVTNVNAAQLGGQAGSYYQNATNLNAGTLNDARLSTNVALLNGSNNFTGTLQHNGNNLCDTSGNCVGSGSAGGAIGGSGTTNKLALFTSAGIIGNSLLSQDAGATTVTANGALVATSFSGDGSGLTNLNAANIATGTVNDSRLSSNVPLKNGSNNFTGTLQHNGNNVCDTSGNCVGTAGGALGGSGTVNQIAYFTGSGYTVGNSIISQDVSATTVTVAGALSSTGNISTSGNVTATGSVSAASLSGNGASVTNVNAAQLGGQAGSYYQNATNLNTGTVDSARISGSYTGITGTGALSSGSLTSGFGTINTTSNITTSVTLQGGTVTAASGFTVGATSGATTTCSGGQVLQNQVVIGGITTGGSCATVSSGGVSTLGALDGGTANAKGATITGTTLYLQSASASFAGLVNTSAQTLAGAKTFSGAATFSAAGTALSVTNNASIGGNLTVGGTSALNGDVNIAGGKTLNIGSPLSFNSYGTGSSFGPASNVPVGGGPQGVATGDFDGDGKADFVVVNQTSNNISVLLSNGDGTFQTQKTTSVGSTPYGVATGDFNGDGKLDVAVSNSGANTVSVLLGNGDGTFTVGSTPAVGATPYGLATGDVNGDGKLDIVAANSGASNVSLLLGNGNGTFQTKTNSGVGSAPYSVAIGDFNNDSKLDIITANESASTTSVLLGNGDGTFQTKKDTTVGTNPYGLVIGDFNADGKLDAATGNYWPGTLSILLGIGDGTFSTQSVAAGTSPEGVTVGDFNGDGRPDLADTDYDGSAIRVLINNGSATPFSTTTTYAAGAANPRWLANGDFNGDGKADIVAAITSTTNAVVFMNGVSVTPTSSSVSITIPNAGNGGLVLQGASSQSADYVHIQDSSASSLFFVDKQGHVGIGVTSARYAIDTTGDINAGGAYHVNGSTGLTTSCTSGQFFQNQVVKGGIVTGGSCGAASGGVNAIGALDGGTANTTGATISASTLYLQSASASFAGLVNTSAQTLAGAKTFSGAATFSAAGTALSVTNNASVGGTLAVTGNSSLNGNVTVASGKALGVGSIVGFTTYSAGSSFATKVTYAAGSAPDGVTTADLNGDGKADVIDVNHSSNTISVFISNGDGTLQAQNTYPVASGPMSVTTGDFNGDGKLDVATSDTGTISVLLGNGDGAFQTQVPYTGGGFGYAIRVGDFNNDGKLDLATVDAFGGDLSVLLGNGDGTFQTEQVTSGLDSYPYSLTLGDFNGDGKLDAAIPFFYGAVEVLLGNGDGTFQTPTEYTVGSIVYSITSADFNNDGKLDLAIGSDDNEAYVMLGNGDGAFLGAIGYPVGGGNYTIIASDFNGDGLTDLATANNSGATVSVLIGNGDGTFQSQVTYGVGSSPYGVAVGDFNGDSKLDLVSANNSSNNISVLLNGVSMQNVNVGLSVTTASASSGGIVIQGSAAQTADYLHIQDSTGTGLFVVDKSGHIGVGTIVPRYAIDVTGDVNVSGVYRVNGTSGSTVACSSGQLLQGQVIKGGITTGGACISSSLLNVDTANSTVTIDSLNISSEIRIMGHLIADGSAPTITADTVATCNTATLNVYGSDLAGEIDITTPSGSSCASTGNLVDINFHDSYGGSPLVVLNACSYDASQTSTYIQNALASHFSVATATPLVTSGYYCWYYHVIDSQ